jgi:hypothetical protein
MESAPDFYFDSVQSDKNGPLVRGTRRPVGKRRQLCTAALWYGHGHGRGRSIVLAGELAEAGGNYAIAFELYESLMRDVVRKCQAIADGGTEWFVPRTRFRLWLSNQMQKILPFTP